MNKDRWLIAIGSWGVIDEQYTELEAEEMRVHKSNWEQSLAKKIKYNDFLKLSEEEIERHWAYRMIKEKLFAVSLEDGSK